MTLTMNPCLDQSCRVDKVVPEQKLRCRDIQFEPGGGGINVSRALCRLGGESIAVYPSGDDTGQRLEGLMEKEEVPQSPVSIEGRTRVNIIVYESSSERQFRFGMPGADLTEDERRQCLDRLTEAGRPDYMVASGSLPPGVPREFYAQVARSAKEAGSRCIVDTHGEALKPAAEEGVFLLKPNLNEFQQLVGREIDSEEDQEREARKLVEQGRCEILVLSLGSAGVLLVTAEDTQRIRSPSVKIRSKVGAGDCTVAGTVLGLSRGMPISRAVRLGVAAGAAAVMTPGTELCRREDAERLFATIDQK